MIREGWGTALPPLTAQERGGGRAKWVSDRWKQFSVTRRPERLPGKAGPLVLLQEAAPKPQVLGPDVAPSLFI